MEPIPYSAKVLDIQLTEFTYNADYNFEALEEIEVKLTLKHRAPPGKDRFDVVVGIDYLNKETSEAVLTTACLTSYTLVGLERTLNPDTGRHTIGMPDDLENSMKMEAVAHARALVSLQAASTPFAKVYISLGTRVIQKMIYDAVDRVLPDGE